LGKARDQIVGDRIGQCYCDNGNSPRRLFGGACCRRPRALTPVIAAAIVARASALWAVLLILVALGVLTVIAVLSIRETARPMRS